MMETGEVEVSEGHSGGAMGYLEVTLGYYSY
jgi:hypothetical protein